MALTKSEALLLQYAIWALEGRTNATDKVKSALRGPAAIYLDSWVLPKLKAIHPDTRDPQFIRQSSKLIEKGVLHKHYPIQQDQSK